MSANLNLIQGPLVETDLWDQAFEPFEGEHYEFPRRVIAGLGTPRIFPTERRMGTFVDNRSLISS